MGTKNSNAFPPIFCVLLAGPIITLTEENEMFNTCAWGTHISVENLKTEAAWGIYDIFDKGESFS